MPTFYTSSSTNTDGALDRLSLVVGYKNATTTYSLSQARSGSGSRFEDQSGSVVFWEHQGEFAFSIDGVDLSLCTNWVDKTIGIKNATYRYEDLVFTMVDGVAEENLGGDLGITLKLSLFGEPIFADLDKDGDEDAAYMLAYEGGGSGVFYYAVFAMRDFGGTYRPTNMLQLGDRIAPQHVEQGVDGVYFMYATRNPNEPFTAPPSLGVSQFVSYDTKTKSIKASNKPFAKTYDVSTLSLEDKKWIWTGLVSESGREIRLKNPGLFSVEFDNGNKIHFTTDCNVKAGTYSVTGDYLSIEGTTGTEQYCRDSEESVYFDAFNKVARYEFTSDGVLHFYFPGKRGEIYFKEQQ